MNIALWEQLDFYTKKLDIERNKAFRNRFQFVGNSCEKDSWAYLMCHNDNNNSSCHETTPSGNAAQRNEEDSGVAEMLAVVEPQQSEEDVVDDDDSDEEEEEEEEGEDSEYEDRNLARKSTAGSRAQRKMNNQKRLGRPPSATQAVQQQNIAGGVLCPTCGKGFKTMGELKQHEPFHTRVRSFVCAICQKSFLYASSYYAHKRRHVSMQSNRRHNISRRSTSTSPENNNSA